MLVMELNGHVTFDSYMAPQFSRQNPQTRHTVDTSPSGLSNSLQ